MNTDIQVMEQVIRLVARTGLYFAKADGNYTEREQAFINAYVEQLAMEGDAEQAQALVAEATRECITLDSLVADTRSLLALLPPTHADMVKLMLYAFINDVVKADGDDCPTEKEALRQWCAALAEKTE